MALDEQQLNEARAIVGAAADVRAAAGAFRAQFPGLRAMVLDALDMKGEQPALQIGKRALYLVANDGHCWTVTNDPAQASAVVFTQG